MACPLAWAAACDDSTPPLATAQPGVVFTYPTDGQHDVPIGTRIVVAFSEQVKKDALGDCTGSGADVSGAFCVVGPSGPVGSATVADDGKSVSVDGSVLEAGTTYQVFVRSGLDPEAKNLPSGALFSFTTRTARPRAAQPTLVTVNGGDPAQPESFRPMLDTSTIRLVFSEPLDPRTVRAAAGSVELVDMASGTAVPALVLAQDVHVSIDPVDDLTAGKQYQLRLGGAILDVSGQPITPSAVTLTPRDTHGATGAIKQVLRTRQAGDPGPAKPRMGVATNVIQIDKPLIGKEESSLLPASVAAELGDPKVLGGPIAFTIRRGQRVRANGFDVKLGGQIPAGLSTGDIEIEFLTDGGGRIYRNPHQAATQRPENERAPLYVDLSFDVAVYSVDPTGNAVLTQSVFGVQASGLAEVSGGVIAIESMTSMELGLLGVTQAPTNLVLELITDANGSAPVDSEPPTLLASFPAEGSNELPVDAGIELIFNEPVDIARLQNGGMTLQQVGGGAIPAIIESHGSSVVVRPAQPLPYSTTFQVVLSDVKDVAGNALASATPMTFSTPRLNGTNTPLTVTAIHPGVPCALGNGTATSPGRCTGGQGSDDMMHPFTLAANEAVEIAFDQPANQGSITLGQACGSGSVRIEQLDGAGNCISAVPGSLLHRDRSISFVPDAPWTVGTNYRITLVSGGNGNCDAGELCSAFGQAASFDPLAGAGAGGPALNIPFTATQAERTTYVFAEANPFTDINGSGDINTGESLRDDNRAKLQILDTSGAVSSAHFNSTNCVGNVPDSQGCLYLLGAMPVSLGEVTNNCTLPDGSNVASCVPVTLSPQIMFATSLSLHATAVIGINTDTGMTVLRVREPATGPIIGYIIDRGGQPTLTVKLDAYLDAPDMSVALSDHDLHSKALSLTLEGPVTFLADGRIAIAASNIADVPVSVHIDAPLGISGTVVMKIPAHEMKLQLLSRPLRGSPP